MATISAPVHNQATTAAISGSLTLSSGNTLTFQPPPQPMEYVPEQVFGALTSFGWNRTMHGHLFLFTHPQFTGHYSWSEAMVLEVSRAFLELHK